MAQLLDSRSTLFGNSQGVETVLENYKRLPRALFAKAWVVTGHVTREKMLEVSGLSEEEYENCSLLQDPAGLSEILGVENCSEPALEELIYNGALKRCRTIWLLSTHYAEQPLAGLPACLVHPVERRIANFLFARSQNLNPKRKSTVIISRRSSKEISPAMIVKHTVQQDDGTRKLKQDIPARTAKDIDQV